MQDITIIIISRDRHDSLFKSMKYWDDLGIAYLVVHHTSESIKFRPLNPRSKYVVSKTSFGERCGVAKKFIQTKYAIICSDDEVFLPSTLARMSDVLNRSPEIGSVGGQTLGIGKYGPILTTTFAYKNMYNYSNLNDDSESRMKYHFNINDSYKQGSMYRLMRESTMIKMLSAFSEISFISTPYIYEITGEILVNYLGKSRYLNEIFWVRNWINKPLSDSRWNRKLYFYIWFEEYKFKEEVLIWRSILESYMKNFNSNDFLTLIYNNRKAVEINEQKKKIRNSSITIDYVKYFLKRILSKSRIPNSLKNVDSYLNDFGVRVNKSELISALDTMTKRL